MVSETDSNQSKSYIRLNSPSLKLEFLNRYQNFLFDCDGVLWLGEQLLPKVKQTLVALRKLEKKVFFLSNNSTKTVQQYVEKFARLGVEVFENEIYSSSTSTASYLKEIVQFDPLKKVLVVGREGVTDALQRKGFQTITLDDDKKVDSDSDLMCIQVDPAVGAVVMGMDRYINYYKLATVHQTLLNPEVLFLATNMDSTYPTPNGTFPGTGTLISPIIQSTGRNPTICGKPSLIGLEVLIQENQLNPSHTVMIGDRLDTDIKFGNLGNIDTCLVLTGVTKELDLIGLNQECLLPKFVLEGIQNLLEWEN